MVSDIRVTGHSPLGNAGRAGQATGAPVTGSLWGRDLVPVQPQAAGQMLEPDGGRVLPDLPARDLSMRRVASEGAYQRPAAGDVFQRAQTLGIRASHIRAGARAALRRMGSPPMPTGRRGLTSRYLSLQLAASCLDDDVSEDEATALFTPVETHSHSPSEFADLLNKAMRDADEFERVINEALSGLDLSSHDAEDLAFKLRQARNDEGKLMSLLRSAQGMPSLGVPERRELRQKIQDEIRELERSRDGAMVLAAFNAAPAAAGMPDAGDFIDLYTRLVCGSKNFAEVLKMLLVRFPLDGLESALEDLKKALADDLAASVPSHDLARLGAILADLGNMHMSSTLLEMVRDLKKLLRRTRHARNR